MKKNYERKLKAIAKIEERKQCRCEEWTLARGGLKRYRFIEKIHLAKRECLIATGDTFLGMKWVDFIHLLCTQSFKCGFIQNFEGDRHKREIEAIFYNPQKGILIYADSFNGETVNSIKLYGEAKIPGGKLTDEQMNALVGCTYKISKDGYMLFNMCGLQGLKFFLNRISQLFELSPNWHSIQLLMFLNYSEVESEFYEYGNSICNKISCASKEVREIIYNW